MNPSTLSPTSYNYLQHTPYLNSFLYILIVTYMWQPLTTSSLILLQKLYNLSRILKTRSRILYKYNPCSTIPFLFHLPQVIPHLFWSKLTHTGTCHPTTWSILKYNPCGTFKFWPVPQGNQPGQLDQRRLLTILKKQWFWSPHFYFYPC